MLVAPAAAAAFRATARAPFLAVRPCRPVAVAGNLAGRGALAPPRSPRGDASSAARSFSVRPAVEGTTPLFFSGRIGRLVQSLAKRPVSALQRAAPPQQPHGQQQRCITMGRTYQPNVRKRNRKLGYHARVKTRAGRKILAKRHAKGRRRVCW